MKKIKLLKIPPSETVAINSLAVEKMRRGETIYNLSAGEPMVRAPEASVRGITQALRDGKTHYPPVSGISDLRQEASEWMNGIYGSGYSGENTIIVNGGKLGIFLLLQALIKPGDEVLIPSPYWVSYTGMTRLFGGLPVIIDTKENQGWKVTPSDISKYASKKSKLLILNNAGNPTGALYTRKEIEDILAAAYKLGLYVISDEVYSGLTYTKEKFVSASSFAKYQDNVAVVESCSKNFAMTGFRVGFVFAAKDVIQTLGSLLSQSTSGVTTMCQYAALYSIRNHKTITKSVNKEMKRRRDVCVEELNKSFGVNIPYPQAGLYVFARLSDLGWKKNNSVEFCKLAIEKAGVALVPGSAFGKEGYVRFSFGEQPEIIKKGIKALSKWIKRNG